MIMDSDIEAIKCWAASQHIVKRVWLFGSRIRGNERPDSDLDIAVEHDALPGDSDVFTTSICEINKWLVQLQPLVNLPLHLHAYISGMTSTIEAGLKDSSVLIYERPDT